MEMRRVVRWKRANFFAGWEQILFIHVTFKVKGARLWLNSLYTWLCMCVCMLIYSTVLHIQITNSESKQLFMKNIPVPFKIFKNDEWIWKMFFGVCSYSISKIKWLNYVLSFIINVAKQTAKHFICLSCFSHSDLCYDYSKFYTPFLFLCYLSFLPFPIQILSTLWYTLYLKFGPSHVQV